MNKLKMGMLFLLLLAVLCGTMTVSAAEAPYETYVFAYDSSVQITPNAYLPAEKIAAFGETLLKNPSDMVVDEERGLIAIADTGNNRIVLLNRNFEVTGTIGPFALPNGTEDTFDSPSGVFITEEDWLVVADTNHGRLVVFDKDNRYLRTIDGPPAQVLPENFKYNPISVAVNAAGQFYVVSKNSNMGVMALDGDGGFQGFIGAQRVASNAAQLLWRAFMTEEQLARSVQFVPVEYSSLTIDHKGFVYVTCSSIDRFELYNTIHSRSMDSTYAPVKKINPAGTDVLRRNGFFPPAGDINFSPYDGEEAVGPSQISKVILLDNGMYMLLDSYGNKPAICCLPSAARARRSGSFPDCRRPPPGATSCWRWTRKQGPLRFSARPPMGLCWTRSSAIRKTGSTIRHKGCGTSFWARTTISIWPTSGSARR